MYSIQSESDSFNEVSRKRDGIRPLVSFDAVLRWTCPCTDNIHRIIREAAAEDTGKVVLSRLSLSQTESSIDTNNKAILFLLHRNIFIE